MKLKALLFSLAACTALSAPAFAQGFQTQNGGAQGESYRVDFDEDPLGALPSDAYIARIHVRPGRVRTLLLRPRTSFVNEMLTSVQAL
ncbi:MAG: hypothetical protein QM756_21010 [Polyangiaceae bacterium]